MAAVASSTTSRARRAQGESSALPQRAAREGETAAATGVLTSDVETAGAVSVVGFVAVARGEAVAVPPERVVASSMSVTLTDERM